MQKNLIATYTLLTKPGIIMGNLITTTAGFALASHPFNFSLFFLMFSGLGAVIASACVFNNYIDQESDRKMIRTQGRALAARLVSENGALLLASLLAIFGFSFLILYTHYLCSLIAAIGFIIYVVFYSFWKYNTRYATLVGSIAGAAPPVAGYCAASGSFDLTASLLFMLLVLWQMPHFFSIALYRLEDYTNANIPVLPVAKGIEATKVQMVYYIAAFIFVSTILFSLIGLTSALIATLVSSTWLWLCVKGFQRKDTGRWAREMFRLSLVIITAFSFMMGL